MQVFDKYDELLILQLKYISWEYRRGRVENNDWTVNNGKHSDHYYNGHFQQDSRREKKWSALLTLTDK